MNWDVAYRPATQGPVLRTPLAGALVCAGGAPVITTVTDGVFFSGGTLTINRAIGGFGTKPTAAPTFFNAFDTETTGVGATSMAVPMSSLGGDGTMPLVATDRFYSGSKSLKCIYPTGSGSKFPRIGHVIGGTELDLYMACWMYLERTAGSGSPLAILKLGRAGCNATYSGQPQFHDTIRPGSSGSINVRDTGYTVPVLGDFYDPATFTGSINKQPDMGSWHFMEYKFRLSTPGGTDGIFESWVDGIQNSGSTVWVSDSTPGTYGTTRNSGNSSTLAWAMSIFDGNDSYGTGNSYNLYADQVYVDVSFVRTILTDNATFASSTKWALQPMTSVSNTQIVANKNTGGFTSGDTIHAHVFTGPSTKIYAGSAVVP